MKSVPHSQRVCPSSPRPGGPEGFTLVELLVVLAVVGLLMALVAPRYAQHIDHAKEVALQQNLAGLRSAIDKFYADRARYPADLKELAQQRYLREVPQDPITERVDTWILVPSQPPAASGVADVRSGAPGTSLRGDSYAAW